MGHERSSGATGRSVVLPLVGEATKGTGTMTAVTKVVQCSFEACGAWHRCDGDDIGSVAFCSIRCGGTRGMAGIGHDGTGTEQNIAALTHTEAVNRNYQNHVPL